MKKLKTLSLILSLVLSISWVAACTPSSGNQDATGGKTQLDAWEAAGFALPHASGTAESDNQYDYNADLFYRNETQVNGADPACIYISLEDITDTYNRVKQNRMYKTESGEWEWIDGESEQKFIEEKGTLEEWIELYCDRYYMATTGNNNNASAEVRTKYGNDVRYGAYSMKTSYDLVNWQRCGTIDGNAIAIRSADYSNGNYWAPEFIRDKKTGYYFMVFSCLSKAGSASTTYPSHVNSTNNQMFGHVAISENPLGPYEFITAEQYIYIRAAKNKDGSVKTGDQPITNKINGITYYEVYDYDENVVGYKNDKGYYNLNGYEITKDTPIMNHGYYYPRYAEDMGHKAENLVEFGKAAPSQLKADGELAYTAGGIDYFPAVDDQGNLYIFFTMTGVGNEFYGIWCVEMYDYISPNWTTLRMVMRPNINKIIPDGTLKGIHSETTTVYEGTVNEATEILYHNGKWYLAYSYFGYTDVRYSVGIAVADNPLGPYDKFYGAYNPVIGKGEEFNNYKGGTGHHVFITAGEELFILYHACHNPEDNYDNNGNYLGRHIGVDRGVWKYVPELGYDMLFGNGATVNLQPKPESYTGYENVAKLATVTGNGDVGSVENVNDGLITCQPFSRRFEYGKTDGGLSVTLKWDSPVEITALMIYNAGSYYQAFNKVNMVRMKLADKPAWYSNSKYNGYCYIENLKVDDRDALKSQMIMRHGSAAIAEFNPITITEMTIYISGDVEDKFTDVDEDGMYWEGYKEVHLSDIYIFGNPV